MSGSERDHQRAAGLPVVAHLVDDAEAGAVHDMDGFFAVLVPARMTAWWDFGNQALGAQVRNPSSGAISRPTLKSWTVSTQ